MNNGTIKDQWPSLCKGINVTYQGNKLNETNIKGASALLALCSEDFIKYVNHHTWTDSRGYWKT